MVEEISILKQTFQFDQNKISQNNLKMVEANAGDGFAQFQNIGVIPDKVMNQEVREYEAE